VKIWLIFKSTGVVWTLEGARTYIHILSMSNLLMTKIC